MRAEAWVGLVMQVEKVEGEVVMEGAVTQVDAEAGAVVLATQVVRVAPVEERGEMVMWEETGKKEVAPVEWVTQGQAQVQVVRVAPVEKRGEMVMMAGMAATAAGLEAMVMREGTVDGAAARAEPVVSTPRRCLPA